MPRFQREEELYKNCKKKIELWQAYSENLKASFMVLTEEARKKGVYTETFKQAMDNIQKSRDNLTELSFMLDTQWDFLRSKKETRDHLSKAGVIGLIKHPIKMAQSISLYRGNLEKHKRDFYRTLYRCQLGMKELQKVMEEEVTKTGRATDKVSSKEVKKVLDQGIVRQIKEGKHGEEVSYELEDVTKKSEEYKASPKKSK